MEDGGAAEGKVVSKGKELGDFIRGNGLADDIETDHLSVKRGEIRVESSVASDVAMSQRFAQRRVLDSLGLDVDPIDIQRHRTGHEEGVRVDDGDKVPSTRLEVEGSEDLVVSLSLSMGLGPDNETSRHLWSQKRPEEDLNATTVLSAERKETGLKTFRMIEVTGRLETDPGGDGVAVVGPAVDRGHGKTRVLSIKVEEGGGDSSVVEELLEALDHPDES